MHEEWLIDGYNLLWDIRECKKWPQISSRDDICRILASFASFSKIKTQIFFDGIGNNDELSALTTKYLSVAYSNKLTVDAVIEKYLYDNRGKSNFLVVTKDRAISQLARGGGSRVLSPKEFMELIFQNDKDINDTLFKNNFKSHRFHRPFHDKLPDL